ncbi:concanavalin A-like lectin/glucanase [Epithele typhae]|uniref:concanavalin A-like lectin/glucanase n=1 Tax=Epithele typhae TaxID=378194 RepID=UPI002007D800|nr:concanavalin A-like lectin/glucanase [Epithele typhae]KAH9932824.1 concanavalin A-like lectin/glucanase [Epithele typhae]
MRPSISARHRIPLILALGFVVDHTVADQTLSGPGDCAQAGAYTICQNLWGADTGTGSQSTTLKSASGSSVAWETTYTWANSPNNVKSYANVDHNTAKGMQLQDIVSAPTSWQWNYQSADSDLRADISYDIWTGVPQSGAVASSASSYEIMIWLSQRGGVGGIGSTVAQNIQLGGHSWNLKHGPNSNWDVFSFITAEGDITNFDADLNDFFQYLIDNQGVAKTQFLQAIQAGTEPFTGSADLVTTSFSVDVSTGNEPASSSSSPPPPSSTSVHVTSSSSSVGSSSYSPGASSASNNGHSSSTTADGGSSTSSSPAEQTGGTVRGAGNPQCGLRMPGQQRMIRRSWLRSFLQ